MKIIFLRYAEKAYPAFLVWLILSLQGVQVRGNKVMTGGPDPVKINENFRLRHLKPHVTIFPVNVNITATEVIKQIDQHQIPEGRPHYDQYIWILFSLDNRQPATAELLLEIHNVHMHAYELYRIPSGKSEPVLLDKGGTRQVFGNRQVFNRRFLVPLLQQPETTSGFLLKIDDRRRNTNLSLTLWNRKTFYARESRDSLFYNLYFGGLFFIGIFSLVIGFLSKYRVFFFYGFYALTMDLFMFDNLGFGFQYIYPQYPAIKGFIDVFLVIPLLCSFTFFAVSYFEVRKNDKRIYRLVKWYFVVMILVVTFWLGSLARLPMHHYIVMNYVLITLTFLLLGLIIAAGFTDRKIKTWFFLSAVIALFSGGILFALSDASLIPFEWFPTNPLLISSVAEFGIFSTALIYEVKTINETKNRLLRATADQQKALLNAYIEGVEKERIRLAGELHDNIGSRLALLKHKITGQNPAQHDLVHDVSDLFLNVRSMSHELSPGDFQVIPFNEYLDSYLRKCEDITGLKINLIIDNLPRFNTNASVQLFRVVQEGLQNVQKHARATTFEVQLLGYETEIIMTLDDDGVGFEPGNVALTGSTGIIHMRTRVESLGGSFEISSGPGKGTHIMIHVPVTAVS